MKIICISPTDAQVPSPAEGASEGEDAVPVFIAYGTFGKTEVS